MVRPPIITPSAIWAISSIGGQGHRFDLRFFRPFRADLSIKKSSIFFPPLIAATSQRGLAPRPAHVSPEWLRYFGGTFLPFNVLPPPLTLLPPMALMRAVELGITLVDTADAYGPEVNERFIAETLYPLS